MASARCTNDALTVPGLPAGGVVAVVGDFATALEAVVLDDEDEPAVVPALDAPPPQPARRKIAAERSHVTAGKVRMAAQPNAPAAPVKNSL